MINDAKITAIIKRLFFNTCRQRTGGESVALLVASRTNNRKVMGSRPTKVVCITVLTGNRCGRPPLLLPSSRKLEFRLSNVGGLGSGMGEW